MKFLNTKSIYYKDVNLIAQYNELITRNDISTNEIKQRIIAAPMNAVIGEKFIKESIKLNAPIICIPRTNIWNKNIDKILKENKNFKPFICIGLNTPKLEEKAKEYNCPVLLDVANGHLTIIIKKVEYLVKNGFEVMAGNVHTKEGAYHLINNGAKYIRCGIGNGAGCITKFATGYNRGQITEILEISELKKRYKEFYIIADGGLENAGDACKAFAAGADYVMLGRIFADCKEAENRIKGINRYWGMASKQGKEGMGNSESYIEGKTLKLDNKEYFLEETINKFIDGIKSGISYGGFSNLKNFIGNGIFEIKNN